MRVLLIEDEVSTAKAIELMLTAAGFDVDHVGTAQDGLKRAKLGEYELILLDLNLPDTHGYDVLQKVRSSNLNTPVIILSGTAEIDSKVRCLGIGADDYMTKPLYRDELTSRIQAVIRRSRRRSQPIIRIGKLALNRDAKVVEVAGVVLPLTNSEFTLLEVLSLRKNLLVSREMIFHNLYSGNDGPEIKVIDVFMCKLRRKLAMACAGENYIETVRGRGFVLREPGKLAEAA